MITKVRQGKATTSLDKIVVQVKESSQLISTAQVIKKIITAPASKQAEFCDKNTRSCC